MIRQNLKQAKGLKLVSKQTGEKNNLCFSYSYELECDYVPG